MRIQNFRLFKNGRLHKKNTLETQYHRYGRGKRLPILKLEYSNHKWFANIIPNVTNVKFTQDGHMRFKWVGSWNEDYRVRSKNDKRKMLNCECVSPKTTDYYRIVFDRPEDAKAVQAFLRLNAPKWKAYYNKTRKQKSKKSRKSKSRKSKSRKSRKSRKSKRNTRRRRTATRRRS